MAKKKSKKTGLMLSTENCQHSLNDIGETCCFCTGLVATGGRTSVVPTPYSPPPRHAAVAPSWLTGERLDAWQRGTDHAEEMQDNKSMVKRK